MAKSQTKAELLVVISTLEAALVAARTQIEDLERICQLKHERTHAHSAARAAIEAELVRERARSAARAPAPRTAYAAPAWQAQRTQAMQAARAQAMATGCVVRA